MFKLTIEAASSAELASKLKEYLELFAADDAAAPAKDSQPVACARSALRSTPKKEAAAAQEDPPQAPAQPGPTKTGTTPHSDEPLKPEEKRDQLRKLLSPLVEGAAAIKVRELLAPFGSVSKIPDEHLDEKLADAKTLAGAA